MLPNGLEVLPRSAWASGLPDPGPLPAEAPGDVRVLLVHHSASANTYSDGAVAGQIRDFHAFHTGPEKGWPDVAYNFFVDRFGRAWEGRSGSLSGPVIGDATGGNQGFSQLVCLIGDFRSDPPTPEAQETTVALLAHLADSYGVDPSPGATTSFVSRGSNRWPQGATVTSATIAGHRDMSRTTCPGDAAYALVTGDFPARVQARSTRSTPATTTTTESPSPTTEPAATTTEPPATTTSPTTGPATTTEPTIASTTTSPGAPQSAAAPTDDADGLWAVLVSIGAGGAALATGVAAVLVRRARLRA